METKYREKGILKFINSNDQKKDDYKVDKYSVNLESNTLYDPTKCLTQDNQQKQNISDKDECKNFTDSPSFFNINECRKDNINAEIDKVQMDINNIIIRKRTNIKLKAIKKPNHNNCESVRLDTEKEEFNRKPTSILLINDKANVNLILNPREDQLINESFHYRMCLICEQYHLKGSIYNSMACEHILCYRCFKGYFESKIEFIESTNNQLSSLNALETKEDFEIKCPVFSCNGKLPIESFRIIEPLKIPYKLKKPHIERAPENHFLEIISAERAINSLKTQRILNCINCMQASLYLRPGTFNLKCLNCFKTFCKFCLKELTHDHFNITNLNYCKVYFRRKLKENAKMNRHKLNSSVDIILKLLILVAAFFYIVYGSICLVHSFVLNYLWENNLEEYKSNKHLESFEDCDKFRILNGDIVSKNQIMTYKRRGLASRIFLLVVCVLVYTVLLGITLSLVIGTFPYFYILIFY